MIKYVKVDRPESQKFEAVKLHNYLCNMLSSLSSATIDYSKVARETGDSYFEWEIIPNYK